ncbi:MAG: CsbD family protein [Spirochaetes bacterium]|nr:CsbD family protein [Spirochaetota bacterium]
MNGKLDILKGRIKEAAGVLADNKDLRDEGKVNQADGRAKEVVEETIQAIKENAQKAIDKAKGSVK